MDKLTSLKIKYPNGTYSNPIEISVAAENVRYDRSNTVKNYLDRLNFRINNIITLPEGATTSDGALRDLQTGYDGTQYDNPGEAVRNQIQDLHNIIPQIDETFSILGDVADARKTGELIAPFYENNKAYNIGDYVNYNGIIYKCKTTIESEGESWTVEHWEPTKVGNEFKNTNNKIFDLKDALEKSGMISIDFIPILNEYVLSEVTNNNFEPYSGWSRTDYISVIPKEIISYSNTRESQYNAWYDENKNFLFSFKLNVTETGVKTVPDNAYYMALSNKTSSLKDLKLKRATPFFRNFFNPTSLNFGTALGSNEDIFQLPAGNYHYLSGTVVNAPTDKSFRLIIFVRSGNDLNKGAILFDSSAKIYFNASHSGVWDAWSSPLFPSDYSSVATSLNYITRIQDNTDLYSLTPGIYYSNASNLINCPTSQSFRLWIFNRTSENTYLAILISTDGNVYTNGKKSSGWMEWRTYEFSKGEIPSYYLDHMESKCDYINNLNDSLPVQSDSFIFITDYHVERNAKNSSSLIKYIIKNTGIKKLFFGGDAYQTNTGNKNLAMKKCAAVYAMFDEIVPEFYPVVGNHEWNHYQASSGENLHLDYELSQSGIYSCFLRSVEPLVEELTNEGNYYVDNKNAKIRYIVLQCDGDARPTPETISWFGNLLSLTPSNYYIFVVTHYINMPSHTTPSINNYSGRQTYFNQMISDILTAYNNGTSYTINVSYTANNITKTYNFSFNYSSAPKNNVICILGGHWHSDDVKLKTSNNILSILTTCDQYRSSSNVITYEENGITLERTLGTIREQAFDVIHVDTTNRKLYMTRIGAGSNRVFDW